MANLPITNVVNVSATQAQAGVNAFNTSNVAIFTDDAPQAAIESITFSGVPASGNLVLSFNGVSAASLAYNATLAAIQAAIVAVAGMSQVVVSGSFTAGLTLLQPGILGAIPLAVVVTNTFQTAGSVAITVSSVTTNAGWSGGSGGYAAYLSPTQAALDFGSASKTTQMVNSLFSQQPNILAGGGQLLLVPFLICKQTLTLNAVPTSGSFAITYNGNTSALILGTATTAQIQTALQAVPGLAQAQVTGTLAGGVLTVYFYGVYGASVPVLATTTNTLSPTTTFTQATVATGESWSAAVTRTQGLVSYLGCCTNELASVMGQTDVLAAAATIQALSNTCMGAFASYNQADIAPGGMIDLVRSSTDNNMRGLYYGDSSIVGGITGINALLFLASYIGLGFSTNFNGSNTTQTMHLKSLATVAADPTMTQTILNTAMAAGADTYPSLQGVAKVFCSGQNAYFDQVYNLCWFVTALQVAGFNYLAQSSTKIPQTESGMDGLKSAYRKVCEQGVTNQYLAPGTWTSSTTFGVQADFLANISQRGYYIYSAPVAQQSTTARAARQAPLVQIAAKQAGAIQSSSVIVNINA